jgi:hypothetical protein
MSKAQKKSTTRKVGKPSANAKQMALAARAAKAVTKAISRSTKGAGKRGKDDMDIHVHVGDVVMMGFDEAVDAEEWGARETKGRKVRRSISLSKGKLRLQAVERSEPAKKKKKAAKKPASKKAPRRR